MWTWEGWALLRLGRGGGGVIVIVGVIPAIFSVTEGKVSTLNSSVVVFNSSTYRMWCDVYTALCPADASWE
jgi:hypothetical protein